MQQAVPIEVVDVTKRYRIYHLRNRSLKDRLLFRRDKYEEFVALQGISLSVPKGLTLGLVGTNGSGKSTLLKMIAGILQPTSGQVRVAGTVSALLEVGAGFHPELTGRENAYLYGSLLGLPRQTIHARMDEIIRFAELEKFIDLPVKTYSSGMYVRLGFAVAINVDPDILLLDEVLAVGDEGFQKKCLAAIRRFQRLGRTIVLVAHSSKLVREFCQEVVWLDRGVIRAMGPAEQTLAAYQTALAGA